LKSLYPISFLWMEQSWTLLILAPVNT
jgi:hypothetical protein